MKNPFLCVFVSALIFHASTAHAQQSDEEFSVVLGLDAGVVTGDFKHIYNPAVGFTARGSYHAGPGFLSLTTGAYFMIPKKDLVYDNKLGVLVPFKIGYKLILQDMFFIMGEAGYSTLVTFNDDAYGDSNNKTRGFTYAPSIGVQFGRLEIGVRYEATAFKGATLAMPMARLGYNF